MKHLFCFFAYLRRLCVRVHVRAIPQDVWERRCHKNCTNTNVKRSCEKVLIFAPDHVTCEIFFPDLPESSLSGHWVRCPSRRVGEILFTRQGHKATRFMKRPVLQDSRKHGLHNFPCNARLKCTYVTYDILNYSNQSESKIKNLKSRTQGQ